MRCLIVGAGLAGFTAAVRAAETGAKVFLIDKSHGELGDGNVLMASGSLRAGGKSPKTGAARALRLRHVRRGRLSRSRQGLVGNLRPRHRLVAGCRCRDRRDRAGKNLAQSEERNLLRPGLQERRRRRAPHEPQETIFESRRELSERQRRRAAHRRERPRHRSNRPSRTAQRSNCAPARRFLPPAASAPTQSWSRNTSARTPTSASCAVPNKTPATACAWRLPSAPRRSICNISTAT